MESIIGIIGFVFAIGVFIAVISIADNTKKTNNLLRLMLNEQNPDRFSLTSFGKVIDNKTKKKM